MDEIGQGFADEVFRVWPTSHSATKLTPLNMNAAIGFLVGRAARSSG